MSSVTNILTGALFGASLLYSGVSSPKTILSQLSLQDFHMVRTFLTASAISAVVAYITNKRRPSSLPARTPAPYSRLTPWDANILGGLLQGSGMALSGACPGTGLVQLGAGISSGAWFVAGGLVGATLWRSVEAALKESKVRQGGRTVRESNTYGTVPEGLGIGPGAMLALWEMFCVSAIVATGSLGGGKGPVDAVKGGLAIGLAQATSVLLRGSMVGVSGGYGQAVEWMGSFLGGKAGNVSLGATQFSTGVLMGAWGLMYLAPEVAVSRIDGGSVGAAAAFIGGILQIFGARLAGGCTSGHGISGMATFGLASFVTVGFNFAGGIGLSLLMNSI